MWCDVCGGNGLIGVCGHCTVCQGHKTCSDCNGTGLDPVRLERAAKRFYEQDDAYREPWGSDDGVKGWYRCMAAAAITEYLRKDD